MTDKLLCEAAVMGEWLSDTRRRLHQIPELGSDLPKTRELLHKELAALGIPVRDCAGGLLGEISGTGNSGQVILLRADMDALPMREESGVPFAATGNAAHTCGHDLHMTMLLGAARLLSSHRRALPGTVRLMFQPDEETASGAAAMIAAGALDGVTAAFGMHTAPGRSSGQINCTPGAKTTSYDRFQITIWGQGGHGAMPQLARSPIDSAAQLCLALSGLTARECAPGSGAVLTIGSIHSGTAGNIIPEEAVLSGTFRTREPADRKKLLGRVPELAQLLAEAGGTTARTDLLGGVPSLQNDSRLCAGMREILRNTLGTKYVSDTEERLSASEDFALVAERVPSLYMTIGTGTAEQGYLYGNHHPKVRYDEAAMPVGAAAYAAAALELWRFE